MIAIQAENGELIKVLNDFVEGEFGFHKSFGLISKEQAKKRIITKKRQFYDFTNDEWLCSFKLQVKGEQINISNTSGCVAVLDNNNYLLKTPKCNFVFTNTLGATIVPLLEDHEDKNDWLNKVTYLAFLAIFLLIPVVFFLKHGGETVPAPIEAMPEPITVQVQKEIPPVEVKTVKIENTLNIESGSKLIPELKGVSKTSRRAVERNLGFLGMVGSKDVTGAIGGVPQHLKVATAGAGPGGTGGSGGESLVGLGKGLRKTTVGNTGFAGLGGIGTKGGAGGGLGGYGNTLVASGEGKGISAIAVSNQEMTIEGGISKYAINATIAKYLNQVRRCYEAELKNKPDLQGLVEMSFEINGSGKLNFAKVSKTTLENANVESCISTRMMDWQFPQPKGGVNVPVKYPFMLRPVGM